MAKKQGGKARKTTASFNFGANRANWKGGKAASRARRKPSGKRLWRGMEFGS